MMKIKLFVPKTVAFRHYGRLLLACYIFVVCFFKSQSFSESNVVHISGGASVFYLEAKGGTASEYNAQLEISDESSSNQPLNKLEDSFKNSKKGKLKLKVSFGKRKKRLNQDLKEKKSNLYAYPHMSGSKSKYAEGALGNYFWMGTLNDSQWFRFILALCVICFCAALLFVAKVLFSFFYSSFSLNKISILFCSRPPPFIVIKNEHKFL